MNHTKRSLDGIWDFTFRETEDPQGLLPETLKFDNAIPVPGCFDVMEPWFARRGTGWFRREVQTGGPVQLMLDGVGVEAEIYWDGRSVGRCPYAYMPESFTFDAGEYGCHELIIAVSNRFNRVVFPFYDFYAFGGIFGEVSLRELPKDHLEWIRITTLDHRSGLIAVKVRACRFFRKKQTLDVRIDGKNAGAWEFSGREQEYRLQVPEFRTWSPEDPHLHRIEVALKDDSIEEIFGIRQIEIRGRELLLNGKKLRLIGYNRHDSHPEFGAAIPPSLMAADLQMVREQGANFIRGSHYPQRESFLKLCDRLGILVWEETLGWDVKPPELFTRDFLKRQQDQARKLAAAHYNHPSIIIWGFLNETESQLPRLRAIIRAIRRAYREIDITRPITFASNKYEKDLCMDLADIVAMNPYPGWNDGDINERSGVHRVAPRLKQLAAAIPADKPYMISEIGAAAIYGEHDPYRARWSEEYQSDLIREVCRTVLHDDRYCGLCFWHFSDAKSYLGGGRVAGFNEKGVLDRYRRPKLAWETIREEILRASGAADGTPTKK